MYSAISEYFTSSTILVILCSDWLLLNCGYKLSDIPRYLSGKTSGEIYLSDAAGNVISSSSVIVRGNDKTSVWQNASFGKVKLNSGQNKIRMHFVKGGDFKVNYIEFKK